MCSSFSGAETISMRWPSVALTTSPPRMMLPRGRRSATSAPDSSLARSLLFWRWSNESFSLSISKKEIALGHGQHLGRAAYQQRAVGAHLVGLRVYADLRPVVVVHHVALLQSARVLHRDDRLFELKPVQSPRLQRRARHEGDR